MKLKSPLYQTTSFYFAKFLNEELLLTSQNGKFHCLSNVCTHRGHLVSECATSNSSLQCRYHGRTFELNGRLKNAPGFKEALNFPTEEDDLKSLSVFDWNNFLFISLNENPNVFKILNQIDAILPDFPYKDLSGNPVKKEYTLDCHWALYCDNYLEGFHIPYVHNDLHSVLDYDDYRTELFEGGVLQIGIARDGEPCFDLPKSSIDYGHKIAAYYYWIFPGLMLNFYPWGLSVNVVSPISVNRTKITYYGYVWDKEKLGKGAGGDLDKVEAEDQFIVEATHRGVSSGTYDRGRYSPTREMGVHHFHQMLVCKK